MLFLAGWRTEDLLLQLLSSDSGLDDTIQVLFNVILLLDGGNKPFSLRSARLVRLQTLLRPPVLYYSRKARGYFCFGFYCYYLYKGTFYQDGFLLPNFLLVMTVPMRGERVCGLTIQVCLK